MLSMTNFGMKGARATTGALMLVHTGEGTMRTTFRKEAGKLRFSEPLCMAVAKIFPPRSPSYFKDIDYSVKYRSNALFRITGLAKA